MSQELRRILDTAFEAYQEDKDLLLEGKILTKIKANIDFKDLPQEMVDFINKSDESFKSQIKTRMNVISEVEQRRLEAEQKSKELEDILEELNESQRALQRAKVEVEKQRDEVAQELKTEKELALQAKKQEGLLSISTMAIVAMFILVLTPAILYGINPEQDKLLDIMENLALLLLGSLGSVILSYAGAEDRREDYGRRNDDDRFDNPCY